MALFSLAALAAGCGSDDAGECAAVFRDDPRARVDLVVNEVVAASADDTPDWIELTNAGPDPIDAGCWTVVDQSSKHVPYTIPMGTAVAPGGFLVIHRDESGLAGFTFGLGASDAVRLRDAEGRIADEVTWEAGQAQAGSSWGRLPDGTGPFATRIPPTAGAPNTAGDAGGRP